MAALKSAARTAAVAFCPDAPLLAAGTMAGAIDLSFSSSPKLEIFKLDFQSYDPELPVVAECPTSERFSRICWGKPLADCSLGLIAGGMVDGNIGIWDPASLINSENVEGVPLSRLVKHTGQVRGLEFNPNTINLLASGADDGVLCIWDLTKPREATHFPPLKGVGSSAQGELSCLSWNRKHHNILASTSYNGTTVVWDLKQQKPVISFPDTTRRRCCVLQWNPEISTQLIIASDADDSPSLRVWDVRNTISPAKEFVGHTKGVLAMSWCPSDSLFLLTCGKDGRTICWDTISGEILCELAAGSNWNFDVQWSPKIRGVLSTSSFDGKIGIYNIETCGRNATVSEFGGAVVGGATALLKAPKWLKRPVGVSFGFGGKLASFRPSVASQGSHGRQSEVYIHSLVTEDSMVARSTEFETAIADREKTSMRAVCERKAQESRSEDERETWNILKVMFEEEGTARTKLLEHLGFSVPLPEADDLQESHSLKDDTNDQLEKLVLGERDEPSPFTQDNGDDFFDRLDSHAEVSAQSRDNVDQQQDEDVSVNGKDIQHSTEESSCNPELDKSIQHALVVGDYKGAVKQCILANRAADALIIAHLGGGSLWEKTRDEYLRNAKSSYLKVVLAMVKNDLTVLVKSRPLESWKETLALLCTYSQREEWTDLCNDLASRLLSAGNTLAATLCFICAGNIENTVQIWSQNLKYNHEGRTFVDRLQDLMEKTVVLALAAGQKQVSPALSKLVETYVELLASQGLLTTAMEYVKLLSLEESSLELDILRKRISVADSDVKETPFQSESRDIQPGTAYQFSTEKYPDNVYQHASSGYAASYASYQPNQPASPAHASVPNYMPPVPYESNPTYQQIPPAQTSVPNFVPQVPYDQTPKVFYPDTQQQYPQATFAQTPTTTQQPIKTFIPSTPPVLKDADRYQQPSRISNPYSGAPAASAGPHLYPQRSEMNPPIQPQMPPRAVPPPPGAGSMFQPSMPGPQAPIQSVTSPRVLSPSVTAPGPPQAATPASAPPPTIQTADTSNVSAEMRPVITTLTKLFNETSEALGGARSKREVDDNSKRIGSLFAKLNTGDISSNAASKLRQLCQALDAGDYATALQIQVGLTTSDWDECSFWLNALKRMIKVRMSMR